MYAVTNEKNLLVILLDGDHLHLELGLGSLQHLNLNRQDKSLSIRKGTSSEHTAKLIKCF